jgi:hypothetical protein
MANSLKHIPILCIDVQGFTTHSTEAQRTIIGRLQSMATEAARFFMPYGDAWTKWTRHGTGDGYYFLFDALPPQVALQYTLNIGREPHGVWEWLEARGRLAELTRALTFIGRDELVEVLQPRPR